MASEPRRRRHPAYRTDVGIFLVAEVYGCKQLIYVRDEDGLYTANPKTDKNATLIPRATADEVIAMDLHDVVIERPVLTMLQNTVVRSQARSPESFDGCGQLRTCRWHVVETCKIAAPPP